MKDESTIAQLIREVARTGTYEIHQGKVVAADADSCDVEVDEGVVQPGVRLNVVTDVEYGVILTPKIGSQAIIARIEMGQEYQLLSCSELDKVKIRVGSLLFEMDRDKIFFNEGKQKGMVLLTPLKTELEKIDKNINFVKSALTQLGTTLEPLVPGTNLLLEGILSGIVPVDTSALENTKIRQ